MKITIYDIAKKANVSTATVSKVINGTGKISETTKQKVLKIIEELDYRPNLMASALMTKKTSTIGLLIPDITNPYFSEVARQIDNACKKNDYFLTIYNTDNDEQQTKKAVDLLIQRGIDALIISCRLEDSSLLEHLAKQKIPVLLFATTVTDFEVNTIVIDEYQGVKTATQHLITTGCKKIYFVGGAGTDRNSNKTRAYRDVMRDHGLSAHTFTINQSNSSLVRDKKELAAIFDTDVMADGIFACSDLAAVGILKAAHRRKIAVPQDLKIVGFDNIMFTELTTPEITTVAQPIQAMAEQGVDILINNIINPDAPKQNLIFTPELKIRESSVY